jgi:hypothetical protein
VRQFVNPDPSTRQIRARPEEQQPPDYTVVRRAAAAAAERRVVFKLVGGEGEEND